MTEGNDRTWQLTAISEALGDLTLIIENTLTVGRGKENDLILASKQVSRQHAVFNVLNGKLFIKDLGSSNGTLINDTIIDANKSKHLNLSDKVSFASYSFEVCQTKLKDSRPEQSAAEGLDVTPVVSATPTSGALATDTDALAPQSVTTSKSLDKTASIDLEEPLNADVKNSGADTPKFDHQIETAKISINEPISSQEQAYPMKTEDVAQITDAKLEAELEGPIPIGDPNQHIHKHPTKSMHKSDATVHTRNNDKEHFKALAEEADPDILRAKQAAAAKFSGTVDLNQDLSSDENESQDTLSYQAKLGTEASSSIENNPSALSKQASHSKKSVSSTDSKVSPNNSSTAQNSSNGKGTTVIWLILIVAIIAIAIWLFNSGTLS